MKSYLIYQVFMTLISILAILFTFIFMLRYASPYASTWDQVDFVLALNRYDLFNMQPHFPGYPYFILGGMGLHTIIENPVHALVYFNIIMMLLAVIPMYLLCRYYLRTNESIIVVSLLVTASYVSIFVVQPMSEGAALAVLWWYFWGLLKARSTVHLRYKILPLFLFSILMGIRLSYLPFGIGIMFLWIYEWKRLVGKEKVYKIFFYLLMSILFQLIWILGVAATEGGIFEFIKLATSFTKGHFTEWGGTAINEESDPFYKRLWILLIYNLIWTGLSSKVILLFILYGGIILFIIRKGKLSQKIMMDWLVSMGLFYFVWTLFAQNIDKPRHILPLIGISILFIFIPFIRGRSTEKKYVVVVCLLITLQTVQGYQLMKEQKEHVPATYQLSNYLQQKSKNEKLVVYTWEEERIMDFVGVSYPYKMILTYDYFIADSTGYPNYTIYITERVLQGFKDQGVSLDGKVRKVRTFQSNTIFDPIYGEITLYKWEQ